MNAIESILVILVELIFGGLAILTQKAARQAELVHAIAWATEVLIASLSFFILVIYSTTNFAIAGFILGLIELIIGTLEIRSRAKDF